MLLFFFSNSPESRGHEYVKDYDYGDSLDLKGLGDRKKLFLDFINYMIVNILTSFVYSVAIKFF